METSGIQVDKETSQGGWRPIMFINTTATSGGVRSLKSTYSSSTGIRSTDNHFRYAGLNFYMVDGSHASSSFTPHSNILGGISNLGIGNKFHLDSADIRTQFPAIVEQQTDESAYSVNVMGLIGILTKALKEANARLLAVETALSISHPTTFAPQGSITYTTNGPDEPYSPPDDSASDP